MESKKMTMTASDHCEYIIVPIKIPQPDAMTS